MFKARHIYDRKKKGHVTPVLGNHPGKETTDGCSVREQKMDQARDIQCMIKKKSLNPESCFITLQQYRDMQKTT